MYMKYKRSVYQSLALITQFGLSMLTPIFLCAFLGLFIGNKISQPIIVVPFFILGVLAGFRNVYYLAKKIYDQPSERDYEDNDKTKN